MSNPPPDFPANPYASPYPAAPLNPADEKQWSILSHVLSIFFGFIPALVFYLLFRDRGPFIRRHTATELNLQITVGVATVVGFVLGFGSFFVSIATSVESSGPPPALGFFFLGYFLIIAVRLVGTIFSIIGAVKAGRGEFYQYPIAIRFVK